LKTNPDGGTLELMNRCWSLSLCLVLVACFSQAWGAAPELVDGGLIESSGSAIAVSVGHAAPEAVDWNNDGLQDLVVGQFSSGKVRLYLSSGSSYVPAFDSFDYVEAGGSDVTTAGG
jgi:hypothetical protein